MDIKIQMRAYVRICACVFASPVFHPSFTLARVRGLIYLDYSTQKPVKPGFMRVGVQHIHRKPKIEKGVELNIQKRNNRGRGREDGR